MKKKFVLVALPVVLASGSFAVHADEGMWTFNNFPKATVGKLYGFTPDDKWLSHVQLSAARLAGGCSASFVSGNGLVMTNHHCARGCINDLSTKDNDFMSKGFYAKTEAEERTCPGMEVNQLLEITDVTARIQKATAGLSDQKYNDAQKVEIAAIEKECATSDKLRCDVVSLYRGGVYNLYKYKRFQDVRLAFAPELAIAFFGGDPDNFNFPRYDLDMSFVRVYEDGKPAKVEHFFTWSKASVKDGDLTFVAGNPGRTDRLLTIAELSYQRDIALPESLMRLAELRGFLHEFQNRGAEQKRISEGNLFGVENSFKSLKGRYQSLVDASFFAQKQAEEDDLKKKIAADPAKQKKYGGAFEAIEKALVAQKNMRGELAYISGSSGFSTSLFGFARTLVRAADELPKSNDKRLPEFAEARLPGLKSGLLRSAPIYDELEIANLTFSLTKMREDLGADHPFVKSVLGKDSPEDLAKKLVSGSTLKDPATRKALFDGGKKAVDASTDPMILLAKKIDAESRATRKKFEDEIDSVLKKNDELVAQARFEIYGTSTYPDATFSPRLSFGSVKGYEHNGSKVAPITNIGGAFDRHTGADPFKLPESWLSSKGKLDLKLPMNLVTTNDIIGGNSGSPLINKNAEIVGLIFDGNIHSLGGAYGFDASKNRATSVSSVAITHTLEKVYGADRLVKELSGKK